MCCNFPRWCPYLPCPQLRPCTKAHCSQARVAIMHLIWSWFYFTFNVVISFYNVYISWHIFILYIFFFLAFCCYYLFYIYSSVLNKIHTLFNTYCTDIHVAQNFSNTWILKQIFYRAAYRIRQGPCVRRRSDTALYEAWHWKNSQIVIESWFF